MIRNLRTAVRTVRAIVNHPAIRVAVAGSAVTWGLAKLGGIADETTAAIAQREQLAREADQALAQSAAVLADLEQRIQLARQTLDELPPHSDDLTIVDPAGLCHVCGHDAIQHGSAGCRQLVLGVTDTAAGGRERGYVDCACATPRDVIDKWADADEHEHQVAADG